MSFGLVGSSISTEFQSPLQIGFTNEKRVGEPTSPINSASSMRRVQMEEDFYCRAPQKGESLTSPNPKRVQPIQGVRLNFEEFGQEDFGRLRQPPEADINHQPIN